MFFGLLFVDLGVELEDVGMLDQFCQVLFVLFVEVCWVCVGYVLLDVEGLFWGGNFVVLCSLFGMLYFLCIDGGILFVEDVGELLFCIECLLYQLYLFGVLGCQCVLLFGCFSDCCFGLCDNGYMFEVVFGQLCVVVGILVIDGLLYGYGCGQLMLLFGVLVYL